jgi:hypothetical protein
METTHRKVRNSYQNLTHYDPTITAVVHKCKARVAGSTLQPSSRALISNYLNQHPLLPNYPHTSTILTGAHPPPTPTNHETHHPSLHPPPPPPSHPRRIPPTLRHRPLLPLKIHLLRYPTLPQNQHRRGHNNMRPGLLRRRNLLLRRQHQTATHHARQRSAVLRNRTLSAWDLHLLGWEFPLPCAER